MRHSNNFYKHMMPRTHPAYMSLDTYIRIDKATKFPFDCTFSKPSGASCSIQPMPRVAFITQAAAAFLPHIHTVVAEVNASGHLISHMYTSPPPSLPPTQTQTHARSSTHHYKGSSGGLSVGHFDHEITLTANHERCPNSSITARGALLSRRCWNKDNV